ncbi:MAG: nitrogen regulation protein NR(II) [Thermodesulfobacteriota bacterium]
MLKPKGNKAKRSSSPIYLAVFSGILLLILIINGLLEINRTRNGFYRLLEREATVLIQHFEQNIQENLTSLQSVEEASEKDIGRSPLSGFFFGLEESVAEYLVDIAHQVDQLDQEKPLDASDLQSLVDQRLITSIEIYGPKGNLLRSWPSSIPLAEKRALLQDLIESRRSVVIDLFERPLSEAHWFSVAILRKTIPGIIALHLNGNQLQRLFRQFAIQRAVSDIGLREGILYLSVQDGELSILAHTDPSLTGRREEDSFLKGALGAHQPLSRLLRLAKGEEVFEVVKPFFLQDKPLGLIRIGYSSKEIDPLLSQVKKNVILSIIFFLILGISAITLIWINQNRHLKNVKEMEDRIQLAERLSSLGHLAAGVAHEIRNPLNAIGMGLQRLKREFLPQEESQKEEYLSFMELISKEIRRVNEIIEQFLSLSRPFELTLKPSSLQDLLKNLTTLLQEEASSRGIQIQTGMSPNLPLIRMDTEKLTQAFLNIMKNGMEAMEPGGILRVETQSFKDQVEISFSDSGSGIPSEQMEKIFNYYYTTKEKGVGLGLPIAHRIIEAHGGQLKVESRVGVGTKVTVRLPIEIRGS